MRHIKTSTEDYYVDDNDALQGEYKSWYNNGQLNEHCHYVNGKVHGEYKQWYRNGQLRDHCHYVHGEIYGEYKSWYNNGDLFIHSYGDDNNKVIHDLLEHPLTDEEKFELQLIHGGKWLCNI